MPANLPGIRREAKVPQSVVPIGLPTTQQSTLYAGGQGCADHRSWPLSTMVASSSGPAVLLGFPRARALIFSATCAAGFRQL